MFFVLKNIKKYNYKPRNNDDFLKVLRLKEIKRDLNLNDIDVTLLRKLDSFHLISFFSQNNFFVDELDVSNIQDFSYCFSNCFKFNCDLSLWDTSNAIDMKSMFDSCYDFNKTLKNFNFYNVERIDSFLLNCLKFNQEAYHFEFNKNVEDLSYFFGNCLKFNQDLSNWNVSNIVYMDEMFFNTKSFKQDLTNWDLRNLKSFKNIFQNSRMERHIELMPRKIREFYVNK